MTAAHRTSNPVESRDSDQFVYLRNVSWREYEAVLSMRGESATPRLTYLNGVLELMSPSRFHEMDKTRFARLLEAWAEAKGLALEGVGSWTLKNSREERGAEPDECYCLGRVPTSDDDRPDIAIEVVWTSGGIDKLEVYRKLAVREVWFYERGALRFFALRDEAYVGVPMSELIPNLDVALLLHCMEQPTQLDALRTLRAALT